jgi:hypothetical protein
MVKYEQSMNKTLNNSGIGTQEHYYTVFFSNVKVSPTIHTARVKLTILFYSNSIDHMVTYNDRRIDN